MSQAIDALKKAVAETPKGPNAPMQKYFIAQCYEKLGDDSQARDYYGRVAQEHPESPFAEKARKDLARLTAAR